LRSAFARRRLARNRPHGGAGRPCTRVVLRLVGPLPRARARTLATRILADRERLVHQARLLSLMAAVEAGRRCRGLGPACIAWALRAHVELRQQVFKATVDEAPCARVPGLLLAPDHVGVRVSPELLGQRADRERIELLEPQDRDILDAALGAF